jgi:hypothetical protein
MRIRVAVPRSTVFPGRADALGGLCDLIELRRPEAGPIDGCREIFHWSEGIFSDRFFPELERSGLREFLQDRGIKDFSFDLGPACERVATRREAWGEYYLPASPEISMAGMARMLAERVGRLREWYPGRLAVELLAYYPTAAYASVCEPSRVAELLESADLLLLLDLAHAEVSAFNLGIGLPDYLEALPLERLVHIHLSRPRFVAGGSLPAVLKSDARPGLAVDAHGIPEEADLEMAFRLAARSAQEEVFVAIEHYADAERLTGMYQQLRRQADTWNAA